eukprot:440291-Pleurochrysis_carterae.AAC.2
MYPATSSAAYPEVSPRRVSSGATSRRSACRLLGSPIGNTADNCITIFNRPLPVGKPIHYALLLDLNRGPPPKIGALASTSTSLNISQRLRAEL